MPDDDPESEERAIDAMCAQVKRWTEEHWRAMQRRRAEAAARQAEAGAGPTAGQARDPDSAEAPETERTDPACHDVPEPAAVCHRDERANPILANGGTKRCAAAAAGRPLRYVPAERDLPPRQIMAARLLLAGFRMTDVAAHLGVNRHTIAGWLRDPEFQREVRRMAMEMPLPGVGAGAFGDGNGEVDESP
jgi:hypothetical protein